MDMEISDGESEDGQISKFEQEEEKVGRIFDRPSSESEPVTYVDVEKCRLTRDLLAKHAHAPWYEDYVKGLLFVGCHLISRSWAHRCICALFGRAGRSGTCVSDL
jgi:hypothetical protein